MSFQFLLPSPSQHPQIFEIILIVIEKRKKKNYLKDNFYSVIYITEPRFKILSTFSEKFFFFLFITFAVF